MGHVSGPDATGLPQLGVRRTSRRRRGRLRLRPHGRRFRRREADARRLRDRVHDVGQPEWRLVQRTGGRSCRPSLRRRQLSFVGRQPTSLSGHRERAAAELWRRLRRRQRRRDHHEARRRWLHAAVRQLPRRRLRRFRRSGGRRRRREHLRRRLDGLRHPDDATELRAGRRNGDAGVRRQDRRRLLSLRLRRDARRRGRHHPLALGHRRRYGRQCVSHRQGGSRLSDHDGSAATEHRPRGDRAVDRKDLSRRIPDDLRHLSRQRRHVHLAGRQRLGRQCHRRRHVRPGAAYRQRAAAGREGSGRRLRDQARSDRGAGVLHVPRRKQRL